MDLYSLEHQLVFIPLLILLPVGLGPLTAQFGLCCVYPIWWAHNSSIPQNGAAGAGRRPRRHPPPPAAAQPRRGALRLQAMARPRRRPRAAVAALGARRCHLLRRPPPPAPLLPPLLLILLVGGGGERRTKPLPAPRRRQKLAVARDRPLRRPPPPLGNWGGELRVCNPATRRRATLPPPPQRACRDDVTAIPVGEYLVFEPAASSPSPHYEVFLIPTVPGHPGPPPTPPAHIRLKPMAAAAAPFCLDERLASLRGASYPTVEEMMEDMAEATVDSPPPSPYEWDQQLFCLMCWQVEYQYLSAEWPPPSYKIDAFSSRTGRWEERVFVREGETATTLEDMKPWNYVYAGPWQGCSVLWQGALYVHSGGACVTR